MTDFETRLYLCLDIFQPLNWHYYQKMSESLAMPLYVLFLCFEVACVVLTVFRRWNGDKEKVEEDEDEHQHSRNEKESIRKGLRRRGGTQRSEEQRVDTKKTENASVFDFFTEDSKFVVSRWKKPGLCYHVGKII